MDPFYKEALAEANKGNEEGGIPIGSVLVYHGKIIGRGHNQRVQKNSAILHAEMDALEDAGRQTADVYGNCVLYTTLSPCLMCSGTILHFGIQEVVIGENRNYTGAEDLLRKKGIQVRVLNDEGTIRMMKNFIKMNPELWNEDIGKSI